MSVAKSLLACASVLVLGASAPAYAAGGELTPREIYKSLGRAVVLVFATDGSAQGSAGTGSVITQDGQVITNAHVVAKDGKPYKKLFVYLKPDKLTGSMQDDLKERYEAQLLDIDPDLDLALLKMKAAPANLPVMPFASPDDVEVGEPVVAIGHPETGGLWTMTTGIISSVVKDFQGTPGKDVFQTEASINRGNSGGPLINRFGHMVGINTSISRRAADGLAITSINFSLKSSVPVTWMRKKDLMQVAYAKPGAGVAGVAIAAAPTKPEEKTQVAQADAPKTYVVEDKKSGTAVVVVEPEDGEEVAEVSWEDAKKGAAQGDTNVSGSLTVKGAKATAKATGKTSGKGAAPSKPTPQAKVLTERRPYVLEKLVSDKIREIRALEKQMDEMQNEIDRRRGGKGPKRPAGASNGNGLW
jgi:serine protease Do